MHTLQKHETKRQYIARLRSKARQLHARIYVTPEGRLLLVRGQPDPKQMYRYLTHLDPLSSHIITPADIGFPRNQVEELTASVLTSSARALTKWRHALIVRNRRRRANDDQAQHREIKRLEARLKQLHKWKRLADSNSLTGQSPWTLDDQQELSLESTLLHSCKSNYSIHKYAWLARLAMWISGRQATSRFCNAAQFLSDSPEVDARKLLRASLAKLDVWQKRAECENWRGIQREIRQWIRQLPTRFVVRAQLSSKLLGKSLLDRIAEQRASCKQAIWECNDGSQHRIAAALATIVVTDNSTAPIPEKLVRYWIEENNDNLLQQSTFGLIAEAKQPAYDRLLHILGEFQTLPLDDLQFVRQQLCLTQKFQDIDWVIKHGLQYYFEETTIRANWARRQIERLSCAGINLNDDQIHQLLGTLSSIKDRDVFTGFADWVASLPRTVRTPRVNQLLASTLFDYYLLGISKLKSHRKLQSWVRSTKVNSTSLSSGTDSWVEKVYQCQEAIGQVPHLPKAIQRQLEITNSRRKEYAYLRRIDSRGAATESQLARLHHLADESKAIGVANSQKLLRAIQDTYVHIALDALRHVIRMDAEVLVGERLAKRLESASLRRLLAFAGWAREMTAAERRLFDEVLLAHQDHGAGYKRTLSVNDRWIGAARAKRIDVDAWLEPASTEVVVDDLRVRIETSRDPLEIFLMGTYFNTCLSLGRENQMAVLANAADANKQVVFLRDQHGNVLGRQLLTISQKYELLGYYCYLNEEGTNEERRDALTAALATFCGQLARRCGIALASEGEPEQLGEQFWYNDEPTEWHKAAYNANLQASLVSNTFVCMANSLA